MSKRDLRELKCQACGKVRILGADLRCAKCSKAPPPRNAEEMKKVAHLIESEGFHYVFVSYSDFDDVKDEEFHRLRKAYLVAATELNAYVGAVDEDG